MASEKDAALAAVPSDSPTIFDKIISKEIPAQVVFEDDQIQIRTKGKMATHLIAARDLDLRTLKSDEGTQCFRLLQPSPHDKSFHVRVWPNDTRKYPCESST